jgi:hypothetical protein
LLHRTKIQFEAGKYTMKIYFLGDTMSNIAVDVPILMTVNALQSDLISDG